jgi:hypothetical protein
MLGYLRRHHVALLALFLALGGTSYAAATLPAKSVGTRELADHAVTKAKLARGAAVSGPRGARGPRGLVGRAGATGANGAKGDTGAPGADGARGAQGASGPAGPQGDAGAKGDTGTAGPAGAPGPQGATGASGAAGAAGSQGQQGAPGDPGTAVAYASIVGTNVYDAKNIAAANVTNPDQGVYCLKGLPATYKSAIATVQGPGPTSPTPGNWDRFASVYSDFGGFTNAICGANTQVMIAVYDVGQAIAAGGPPATFAAGPITVWLED